MGQVQIPTHQNESLAQDAKLCVKDGTKSRSLAATSSSSRMLEPRANCLHRLVTSMSKMTNSASRLRSKWVDAKANQLYTLVMPSATFATSPLVVTVAQLDLLYCLQRRMHCKLGSHAPRTRYTRSMLTIRVENASSRTNGTERTP